MSPLFVFLAGVLILIFSLKQASMVASETTPSPARQWDSLPLSVSHPTQARVDTCTVFRTCVIEGQKRPCQFRAVVFAQMRLIRPHKLPLGFGPYIFLHNL